MGLERLEERPVTLLAHETSITLESRQLEYRRHGRVAVLRGESSDDIHRDGPGG
jgi:hypothetical protein